MFAIFVSSWLSRSAILVKSIDIFLKLYYDIMVGLFIRKKVEEIP